MLFSDEAQKKTQQRLWKKSLKPYRTSRTSKPWFSVMRHNREKEYGFNTNHANQKPINFDN